jgi:hypothetical protein
MDNAQYNNGIIHELINSTALNVLQKLQNYNIKNYLAVYCGILGFTSNLPLQPERERSNMRLHHEHYMAHPVLLHTNIPASKCCQFYTLSSSELGKFS